MGDFFGPALFYLFCNYFGGTLRWMYGSVWRTIFNKPRFKYKEYIVGPEKSKNHFDIHGHHFNNAFITVIFIIIFVKLLS